MITSGLPGRDGFPSCAAQEIKEKKKLPLTTSPEQQCLIVAAAMYQATRNLPPGAAVVLSPDLALLCYYYFDSFMLLHICNVYICIFIYTVSDMSSSNPHLITGTVWILRSSRPPWPSWSTCTSLTASFICQ